MAAHRCVLLRRWAAKSGCGRLVCFNIGSPFCSQLSVASRGATRTVTILHLFEWELVHESARIRTQHELCIRRLHSLESGAVIGGESATRRLADFRSDDSHRSA